MAVASPLVSVITATYNRSNVLRYAIESVLWQTFSDFEMLVIGDACTDDSADVVASFADQRVCWTNLAENSGNQSAPNNAGLEMARGKYVAYLGHDDLWLPHHLQILAEKLEETGADIAYSWMEIVAPPETGHRAISGITPFGTFEPDIAIPPTSLMHRASLWHEIGGWKDYRTIRLPTDQEFFTRAFRSGKSMVAVKRLSALKFSSIARPDCYVEKPSHEQADYVRQIKSDPDFVTNELGRVIESLILRYPEEMSRSSESELPGEIVTRARITRGLDRPVFPLAAGGRIDLADPSSEPFLSHGWSYPDGGFRWTNGDKAALLFALGEAQPIELEVQLAPFLVPGKLPAQTLRVALNGAEVAVLHLIDPAAQTFAIPLPPQLLGAENKLDFLLPNATAPRALGLSLDVRRLGVGVYWIRFVMPVESVSPAV